MNKHWKTVALGEVLELDLDKVEVSSEKSYEMVGVYSFGKGLFFKEAVQGINTSYKHFFKIRPDHIIMSQLFGWEGALALSSEQYEGRFLSSQFPTFLCNPEKLDRCFLGWLMQRPTFWQDLGTRAKGMGDRRRTLNPDSLLKAKIHLPPLTEQRRIVAQIEALAAKVEEAKKLRQKIATDIEHLLAAMAHRNDLSEDEKLKQGWLKLKLGDVLSQVKNAQSVKATESYRGLGIYSFGKGCIKKSPISGSEIKATTLYKVSAGQFIYARLNAYEGSFALVTNEFDGCYVSNEFPTFNCNAEYILPEFLMAYFHTPHTWQELRKKITGIGGDSGNRRIRLREKDFLSHQILLPPLSWQHKIKQIHRQQKDIKPLQNTVEKELNALMPAILDKAFKGEL